MSSWLTKQKKQSKSSSGISKFIPRKWQDIGIKFLLQNPAAGLFLAPGLGKTMIVLMAFYILWKRKTARTMVVVAKKRIVYMVWRQEIEKWGLPFTTVILHGPKKDKAFQEDADIYLINYEGLPWLYNKMKKSGKRFDVIAFDESSKIKNTNTARFKTLRKMLGWFDRRIIMTGSPVPNSLLDIFGQVYALDLGKRLGQWITQFRNRYFYPSGFMGYDWEPVDGAEEAIFKAIGDIVLRFGDDLLDLPPYVPVTRYVDLPKEARDIYDDLEQEFIAEINEDIVVAMNAAVASGKLRQVANGGLYVDDADYKSLSGKRKRRVAHLHDEKTEELIELVEELQGAPCIVAYEFHHDLERLRAAFPNAPYIGAGVSEKEGIKIQDDFNAGKIPVLLAHPESAAHGLNLQSVGNVVIFYSLTWNLENYEQFIRRLWRQGQKKRVFVYHIVARNTVDELMLSVLEGKDRTQRRLLEALKHHYTGETTVAKKRSTPGNALEVLYKRALEGGLSQKALPKLEEDEMAEHNYVERHLQLVAGWTQDEHESYQAEVTGKEKAHKGIAAALAATNGLLVQALNAEKSGEHWALKDRSVINQQPTEEEEAEEMEATETKSSKFGGGKKKATAKAEGGKKARGKSKAAAKKATAKKAPAKKAAAKGGKTKSEKQKAKEVQRGTEQAELLKLLQRKSGVSVTEAAEKMGKSESNIRSMIGAMRKNGTKIAAQGGGVFKA